MNINEILKEADCEELIPVFENNDIDFECFKTLNDEELKELVPSVGKRKKLKEKIKEANNEEHVFESPHDTSASTITLPGSEPSSSTSLNVENEVSEDLENILSETVDLFFKTTRPKLPDFDLNTLLQTNPLGKSILNFYDAKKKLDNTHQNRLVDIIIKHLYTFIINYRLNENEYLVQTAKIISLFPNEAAGTYFIPAIKKSQSRTGKSKPATGKLVCKVNNIVRLSGEAVTLRKRKHSTDNRQLEETPTNIETHNLDDYNTNEDVIWLRHNSEPWATVLDKWRNTFDIRRKVSTYSTVNEYIEKWPILHDLRSESLINLDFENIYPHAGLRFHIYWDRFFETIVELNESHLRDSDSINLLKIWRTCGNEDGKHALELFLLPYLIPPKGRVVVNRRKHWKYSTLEVSEALLVHVKTAGDINQKIEEQKEKANQKSQRVQPFLLIEGEAIYSPRTFYLVVDNIQYQFHDFGKCFDTLFKLFHAFDAQYPVQAEYIYTLIQKCVYGISTESDKVFPNTEQIISTFLKKIKINQKDETNSQQ